MSFIEKQIFDLAGVTFPGKITYQKSDSLTVRYDGHDARIGCASRAQAARGLFLLAVCIRDGARSCPLTSGSTLTRSA